MIRCLIIIVVLSHFAILGKAQAQQAQTVLIPTRVVLEKGERSATVIIKNSGNATGLYRIELEDKQMPETGILQTLEEGKDPYSIIPMVRISPRRVTLDPGEDQRIRLMIRKPKNLEDGEYRSHLKVLLADSNVSGGTIRKKQKNVQVGVGTRLAVSIPVILRHGKTSQSVTMDEAGIRRQGKHILLDLAMSRTGNRSSFGDIKVVYTDQKGVSNIVKFHPGIAIYRGTDKRRISLPLDIPDGVVLGKGTLKISYIAQEKDGGILIAEKDIIL